MAFDFRESANCPVNAIAHQWFRLVSVLGVTPYISMLFLGRRSCGLRSGQIHRIGFHQGLGGSNHG